MTNITAQSSITDTPVQRSILDSLKVLKSIDNEFPLQYAICFLEIALHQGISVTELSERTHIALSTVSRIVKALSKTFGAKSYGLIEVKTCATERRRKELYISVKGSKILKEILN